MRLRPAIHLTNFPAGKQNGTLLFVFICNNCVWVVIFVFHNQLRWFGLPIWGIRERYGSKVVHPWFPNTCQYEVFIYLPSFCNVKINPQCISQLAVYGECRCRKWYQLDYHIIQYISIHLPKTPSVYPTPLIFLPNGWRLTKMSTEHISGYIGWLWGDATNNHTAFAKASNEWTQIQHKTWKRAVVKRPDHHCGDDLALSQLDRSIDRNKNELHI